MTTVKQNKKILVTMIIILTFTLVILTKKESESTPQYIRNLITFDTKNNPGMNWRELNNDEIGNLSILAQNLFLQEDLPPGKNRKYQILVWKYGKSIENRHLKQFTGNKIDPFKNCRAKNCDITYESGDIKTADIVIFHLHRMKGKEDLPKIKNRNPNQIWAFLTDESPHHTFLKLQKLTDYNGIFNWSMTYRMDSDIPVPYGRTVLLPQPLEATQNVTKKRDVLVAILGSNCGGKNNRWKYVEELQKYIKVDVYGKCGKLKSCPGHFTSNCRDIDDYLFYLAFENSNCDEYITEKLWWNAFEKNSIPVVMGASPNSYRRLLPPNSYLNVEDYAKPQDLASHILYLNQTGEYAKYFEWKRNFQVLNEHGYFQSNSFHYCRVCEALNFNEKKIKIYGNLSEFWSVKKNCHPAWNM